MTDTLFPDISEFQPNADLHSLRAQTGAVGVRVNYGTTLDKTMPARRDAVRAAGFDAVLWYVFLRPTQDIAAQVSATINCLGDLKHGELVFVDWEKDLNGSVPSTSQRDQALELLDARYGVKAGLYASASMMPAGIGRPTWVAAYATSEPRVTHNVWQYTDGQYTSGGYSPVNWPGAGKCDTSVFHGSSTDLANLFTPQKVAPMYDPAIVIEPIVADLGCPTGGAWNLASSGAVYAWGGAPYHGGANGKAYFNGRKAARVELPNAQEVSAGKVYTIVATSGERYSYPE